MFTGIVQAVGRVAALERRGGDARITIDAGAELLRGAVLGESIAVNGCCLTAVAIDGGRFSADCSTETLARTTLGGLAVGAAVDLERALTLAAPLGGHLMAGHVDGVGEVMALEPDARAWRLRVRAPAALARYLAPKGSVAVDGVSLTVNAVDGATFDAAIVPHTHANTVIGGYAAGTPVNLEVDLIARYVERLLAVGGGQAGGTAR